MTAAQILSDALSATESESNNWILRDAIEKAIPQIKIEVLDAWNQGEDSGFASASVVADRVLG